MPSSPILLLGSELEDREVLASLIQRMGHTVTVEAHAGSALAGAAKHHLLVIDMPEAATAAFCRIIRENPALANLAVLCIAQTDDVEERVRYLEAGTDDVIAKPFDARELEARIEALLLRFQHTPSITPPPSSTVVPVSTSTVIALFSPKGGAGTTTIAVNLALTLRQRSHGAAPVAIVDLDLQWGQVATQLNLNPQLSIVELARDSNVWAEADGLKQYAQNHPSGLIVYPAPLRPDQSQLVVADEVRRMIEGIRDHHETVVIDAGSVLDDRSLTVLEVADRVVIPMTPEIPALRVLHALLEFLSETGGILDKTTFLVNHIFAKDQVRLRDIESAVQARVSIELPYDPILYLKAANEGIPVILSAPKGPIAERFGRLAAMVMEAPGAAPAGSGAPAPVVVEEGARARISGLLKRG